MKLFDNLVIVGVSLCAAYVAGDGWAGVAVFTAIHSYRLGKQQTPAEMPAAAKAEGTLTPNL